MLQVSDMQNFEISVKKVKGDFYCGIVDGSAIVGGAEIPINGSTFGSVRNTAVGALGDDLPDPVAICPVP